MQILQEKLLNSALNGASFFEDIFATLVTSPTQGLFVSVIQTIFHYLEKVICVCFSHLRRFGRRPNHPSILSDGWTASENKLSQKFKEFNKLSRRPSFPFVSIICRQSKIFLSVCLDCGLAVFILLAAFLGGTLDNRENVCLHFSLSISDLFVYIATMKC